MESRVICAWNTLGVMRGITRGILAPKSSGKILHMESFFVGHNVSFPYFFYSCCLVDAVFVLQARKNREISSLQRKIDEVPSRAELTQYQRRFVELYNHGT